MITSYENAAALSSLFFPFFSVAGCVNKIIAPINFGVDEWVNDICINNE